MQPDWYSRYGNNTSVDKYSPSYYSSSYSLTPRFGRTGLSNIGNTCYMNTALQCLSHCLQITQLLLSGEYKKFINKDNTSGSGGRVMNAYVDLLKRLWMGTSPYTSPADLKSVVEIYASQFQGYDQHDSQEFFIMFLDLLHEDMNKITKKPYIEYPVYTSFSPEQSSEMWSFHLQRNQSPIIDWFYGQTVTFVRCTECGEQRVRYEPFSFLTLPLPPEMTTVYINLMPGTLSGFSSSHPIPDHVFTTCKKSEKCSFLINEVARACDVLPSQVVLVTYRSDTFTVLEESESISPNLSYGVRFLAYLLPRPKGTSDLLFLVAPSAVRVTCIGNYESMEPIMATPFVLLLDSEATCWELGERLNEAVASLQLPVEAIQKECKAWFGQIARIRAEVEDYAKKERQTSSYSSTFYNGYGSSSNYRNNKELDWDEDEDDSGSYWGNGGTKASRSNGGTNSNWGNSGSNPSNSRFGSSFTYSSESSLPSASSSVSALGTSKNVRPKPSSGSYSAVKPSSGSYSAVKPSSGSYGVVKPRSDRTTSVPQHAGAGAGSAWSGEPDPVSNSDSSLDERVYFNEKEGGFTNAKTKSAESLRKELVKPSDYMSKILSSSSSSSSSSSTKSNSQFGLPGGSLNADQASEAPKNEAISGVASQETSPKGVKAEKSQSRETAQFPAKDPKIVANSMEVEEKPVQEGRLRVISKVRSVPLRAIEERTAGQKLEIPTEGVIVPVATPRNGNDEFESNTFSSDESVYSESDMHPMDLDGYQTNQQILSSPPTPSNSIEPAHFEADEADLEWVKWAPFLPLYHLYSSRSSIEPKKFFLCNDRNAKVRSLLRTYASSVTTIGLVVKCIESEKMRQKVTSSHYYDCSYGHPDVLNHDPLWSRLFSPLSSAKLHDFEKEKAALNPENSLTACLNRFSTRGNLDNENKWFCPRCQSEVCAENRTLIDRLPDVLILQLERFEYDQSAVSYSYYSSYSSYGARRKINTTIGFPLTGLEMKPWLHEASREQSEDCVYDLVSICNHSGTSSGGHYYCYAKDENEGEPRWKEYNDSSVGDIEETQLVRSTAYVLFYQRRRSALRSDALCREIEKKAKEEEEARKKEEEERRRKWEEERQKWVKEEEERRKWREREEEEEEEKGEKDEDERKKWVEEPADVDSWPYMKVGSDEESKAEKEAVGTEISGGIPCGIPVVCMDDGSETKETEANRSDLLIQVTINDSENSEGNASKEGEASELGPQSSMEKNPNDTPFSPLSLVCSIKQPTYRTLPHGTRTGSSDPPAP